LHPIDVADIDRDLRGSLCGILNVLRNLLGGNILRLHRDCNCRSNLGNSTDGRPDPLDCVTESRVAA